MHHPDGLGGQNRADVLATFVEDKQLLRNLVRQGGPPGLAVFACHQHAPAERFETQDAGPRRTAGHLGRHGLGRVEDPLRHGLITRELIAARLAVRGRHQTQHRAATFGEGGHRRSARSQQRRDRRIGAGQVRIGAVSSGREPGGDQAQELGQTGIRHCGMNEHRFPFGTWRGDSQHGQRLDESLAPVIGGPPGRPQPGRPMPARPEASAAIRCGGHLGQPHDQASRPPVRHLHGGSPAGLIAQHPGHRVAHRRLDFEGPGQSARAQVPAPAWLQQVEQAGVVRWRPGHVGYLPSPYHRSQRPVNRLVRPEMWRLAWCGRSG